MSCIIDVNGTTPVATLSTSSISLTGGASAVMISKPFQTAPTQVPRSLQYNLLASGISTTI